MENVRVGSLSLLARTCPACSAGRVSHGGRDLGGFKLSSKRRHNRVAIAVIDYTASRRGLLVLKAMSRDMPVYVDGVIAAR